MCYFMLIYLILDSSGLDINCFAHQLLWLAVSQSYYSLNIFTHHNFVVG